MWCRRRRWRPGPFMSQQAVQCKSQYLCVPQGKELEAAAAAPAALADAPSAEEVAEREAAMEAALTEARQGLDNMRRLHHTAQVQHIQTRNMTLSTQDPCIDWLDTCAACTMLLRRNSAWSTLERVSPTNVTYTVEPCRGLDNTHKRTHSFRNVFIDVIPGACFDVRRGPDSMRCRH